MRISNRMIVDRMLAHIAGTQQRLATVQERVASGRRINRPSDDPLGTSRVLAARSQIDRDLQYQRNIAIGTSDLAAAEAALDSVQGVLARATELAVQAANGSLNASDRAAIAIEVSQLIEQALSVGNTKHAGRYLFAGHLTTTTPFVPDIAGNPTTVTYNGDTGAMQREFAEGERVQTNLTGDRAWPGVFAALIQFRNDLKGNDLTALGLSSGALDAQLEAVLGLRSELGSKMRSIELAEQRLGDGVAATRVAVSNIEDADLAENIVELQIRENAYQAALGVAGRTLNLNLLDFLR